MKDSLSIGLNEASWICQCHHQPYIPSPNRSTRLESDLYWGTYRCLKQNNSEEQAVKRVQRRSTASKCPRAAQPLFAAICSLATNMEDSFRCVFLPKLGTSWVDLVFHEPTLVNWVKNPVLLMPYIHPINDCFANRNVTLTLMCSLHKCWADSMISSNYNVEGNGGWSSFCCRPRVAAWRLWSLSIELFIQAHNLFVTGKVQCGKIRRRNFQRPNVSVEGWNYRFVISFKTWLFVKSHK